MTGGMQKDVVGVGTLGEGSDSEAEVQQCTMVIESVPHVGGGDGGQGGKLSRGSESD